MSARRSEAAGDPDAPRRAWRLDRRRAWWVPDGDWGGDHQLVVVKRGRDPKWYARARRVGCVAARDTADQAKSALEAWLDMVSAPREAPRREHDGFDGKLSDVERGSAAADAEDPHHRRVSRLAWESRDRKFDVVVPPGQGLRVVVDRGLSAGALMCWAVELDPLRARRRVSRIELRVHYDADE